MKLAQSVEMWLFCFLLVLISPTLGQIVDTEYGQIEGHPVNLEDGTVINSFLGIPFTKPPLDDLRFARPEPPDPWDEVFVADTLKSACPQGGGTISMTHPLWNDFDEDCLTLNIYAPNDASGAPYPVMVWIHGGAYRNSANIQYPGHFLAQKGVVVVVPNYRLGALGFMSTMDDVARGNWGNHDQIQSLRFIQNNIANFGGDPTRVTLFGQSAGASSIGVLMMAEEAEGLFHRAICQSGSEMSMWATMGIAQQPRDYTAQVAAKLDCPTEDSQDMMDCLRTINATILRENQGIECTPGFFCQGFAPVVDGEDGLMPDHPWRLREQERFNKEVQLIAGQTTDDGSPYTLGLIPESIDGGFNRTQWLDILRNRLISIFEPQFPERFEDVFQAFSYFYTRWPHIDDLEINRQQFTEMITDVGFGLGSNQQITSQSQHSTTYFFELGLKSSNMTNLYPEWMGVPHNGELPYVLGYPKLRYNPEVQDDSLIYFDIVDWTEEDAEWADFVQTLWTNFAKFGDPTPDPVQPPEGEAVTWRPFDMENYDYMYFDYETEMRSEFRQKNFAFYSHYLDWMTGIDIPLQNSDEAARFDGEEMLNRIEEFYQAKVEERLRQM